MIKRLTRIISLLALAVSCAWTLLYGMPALEKMTPSKTIPASITSTATRSNPPMLATASKSTQTASTAPPVIVPTASMIPTTPASIEAIVMAENSLSVWVGPGVLADETPVGWFVFGSIVFIDECQHGWGHLEGGPGWVNTVWLDPDVCGGGG